MADRAGVVSVDVVPNLQGFGAKVDGFARALKPLGIKTEIGGDFARKIEGDRAKAQRSLDSIRTTSARRELTELGNVGERQFGRLSSLANVSGTSMLAVGAGGIALGQRMIGSLRPAVAAASDLSEAASKSEVVFGGAANAIDTFATTAAEKLGLSKRQALDATSTFATFGKSAGLTGDELAKFATKLTSLSSDLASFYNTDSSDAILAIGAGLRGETEPLRRYGVLLDDASLRQEALRQGIVATTKVALTPQQRVLAAQALILKQTSDAQGDFARTSDGLANSQRTAAAEAENAKAALGEGLQGAFTSAAKAATGLLSVVSKIPGATSALGVGALGVGLAAMVGGAVSSIAGGVKVLRDFRAGLSATATAAESTAAGVASVGTTSTYSLTAVAAGANAATTATEGTAAAMGDVAATSGVAGTSGTTAMASIGTSATAATGAVLGLSAALSSLNVSGIGAMGAAAAQANGSMAALTARAGVIDAESWEVPAASMRALSSGATAAEASVGRIGGAMSRVTGAASAVGGALGRAATSVRGFVGGLPKMATGLIAATVAFEGFKFAAEENARGFNESVKGLTSGTREILAAADPERAKTAASSLAGVAQALNGIGADDAVPMSAVDRVKDFFGLFSDSDRAENQMEVRKQQLKELASAIDQMPADRARAMLDNLKIALASSGMSAGDAEKLLARLYRRIEDNAAIDRARNGVQGLGGDLDAFGFAVDKAKSKYEQFSSSLDQAMSPMLGALDASTALDEANQRVADAEANVARIRSGGAAATKGATDDARKLADALESVASARRNEAAAERDRANAARDLAELQRQRGRLDPARHPNQIRELDEKIRDQQDTLASANDRVADSIAARRKSERDLSAEKAGGVGPTDDLTKAEKELADARRDAVAAAQRKTMADAALRDEMEKQPGAIAATFAVIDDWVRRGQIAADTAAAWKEQLLLVAAAAAAVDGQPGMPGSESPTVPPNATLGPSGKPATQEQARGGAYLPPPTAPQDRNELTFAKQFVDAEKAGKIAIGIGGQEFIQVNGQWMGGDKAKAFAQWKATGRRGGGPLAPRALYELVEDGRPEMVTLGGRTFLATGDQKGHVTSYPDLVGGRASAVDGPNLGRPAATADRVDIGPMVEQLQALRRDVANLANVTYAPTIHARPDQVEATMREAFAASRRAAWVDHARAG